MDNDTINETVIDHAGRIATLETEVISTKEDLKEIKDKLDALLHLKSKGMGALALVSLLISSGVVGLVVAVMNFVNRPHL